MKLRVSAFHKKTRWSCYWLQQMGQNPMNVPTVQRKENTSNFLPLFYIVVPGTISHGHSITSQHLYFPKTCSHINSEAANDFCCCLIQTQTQINMLEAHSLKWISIKHKQYTEQACSSQLHRGRKMSLSSLTFTQQIKLSLVHVVKKIYTEQGETICT